MQLVKKYVLNPNISQGYLVCFSISPTNVFVVKVNSTPSTFIYNIIASLESRNLNPGTSYFCQLIGVLISYSWVPIH